MAVKQDKIKIGSGVARIDACVRRSLKFGEVQASPGDEVTVIGEAECGMMGDNPPPRKYYWVALSAPGQSSPHTYLWSDGHLWHQGEDLEECVEKSGSANAASGVTNKAKVTVDQILEVIDSLNPDTDFTGKGAPKVKILDGMIKAQHGDDIVIKKSDRDEAIDLYLAEQGEDEE